MRVSAALRNLGTLLMGSSVSMLPPVGVALLYKEQLWLNFLLTACLIFFIGLTLFFILRKNKKQSLAKEGFLVVVLFWVVFSGFCAIPFISAGVNIKIVDAIFESVSGLTATGATVLTGLDYLPRSLLYYRQQLQLLGGIGIILLAIAILPALKIGGMQLFRAEFSGSTNDAKLTPKLAQSAKGIWLLYFGSAVFCALCYWSAGMELFDAIGYSFGTVSTGGFATHDLSMGYFSDYKIHFIAITFMLLGAINFTLHYLALAGGQIHAYNRNLELKVYLCLILIATTIIFIIVTENGLYENKHIACVESIFHVVSLATTTGLANSNYYHWPIFAPILLLLLGLVGGCSGSTSGGIKIIRLQLLYQQGMREVKRLIHPRAHYVIRFGQQTVSNRIINAIWGYLATYVVMFTIFLLSLLAVNLDFITAWSATAASLSNIGPGLGAVANNYQDVNDAAKILLSFAMLVGRLEFFTVIVVLTPTYWRS